MWDQSVCGRLAVLACLAALTTPPKPVSAFHSSPDTLLRQFDDGYTLVAATVTAFQPGRPSARNPLPLITFRVDEVLARPVGTKIQPFKIGQSVTLRHYVGDGGVIEWWWEPGPAGGEAERHSGETLPVGTRFILTLRRTGKGKRCDHADGSGAARPVTLVTPDERRIILEARALAVLPAPDRVKKCCTLIADPAASESLRLDALFWLVERQWRGESPEDEAAETDRALRAAWNDPHAGLCNDLLGGLDRFLWHANDPPDRVEDRRRVWFARLFGPLPLG